MHTLSLSTILFTKFRFSCVLCGCCLHWVDLCTAIKNIVPTNNNNNNNNRNTINKQCKRASKLWCEADVGISTIHVHLSHFSPESNANESQLTTIRIIGIHSLDFQVFDENLSHPLNYARYVRVA